MRGKTTRSVRRKPGAAEAALPLAAAADPAFAPCPPEHPETPFSLFEGDWLNRFYSKVGVGRFTRFALLKRCFFAAVIAYAPIALLAWHEGLTDVAKPAENFFADFAAYLQLLIALPLFLVCEPIMDSRTRGVVEQMLACDIVRPEDRGTVYALNARMERLRKSRWPDLICLFWAFFFSLVILVPEFQTGYRETWHVQSYDSWWFWDNLRMPSEPGFWTFLISLPLLNYTWLRFVWKVLLWSYYLFRVTRLKLDLHPTHPDLVGGIGFISDAQGQFALFLLAYGLSNIAAPVGYEIVILNYDMTTLTVWGPMLGFAIGGPLVFTLPLFMFTRQLFKAKHHALAVYRERVTESSRRIEAYWQPGTPREKCFAEDEIREMAELSTLSTMFTHIENMRVVPFDLRSFAQLAGSSFGSIATLLPLLEYKGQVTGVLDLLSKIFGLFGHGG